MQISNNATIVLNQQPQVPTDPYARPFKLQGLSSKVRSEMLKGIIFRLLTEGPKEITKAVISVKAGTQGVSKVSLVGTALKDMDFEMWQNSISDCIYKDGMDVNLLIRIMCDSIAFAIAPVLEVDALKLYMCLIPELGYLGITY